MGRDLAPEELRTEYPMTVAWAMPMGDQSGENFGFPGGFPRSKNVNILLHSSIKLAYSNLELWLSERFWTRSLALSVRTDG